MSSLPANAAPGTLFKFTVKSADEAAVVIRERLGPGARVLSVRNVEATGLSGLDTMHGCPAQGVALVLRASGEVLFEGETDADGRCRDLPVLTPGPYRIEFAVAAYFRGKGVALPEPPFLDIVAIDFGIAEAAGHYHVPLLVSPYAYSTYRGS